MWILHLNNFIVLLAARGTNSVYPMWTPLGNVTQNSSHMHHNFKPCTTLSRNHHEFAYICFSHLKYVPVYFFCLLHSNTSFVSLWLYLSLQDFSNASLKVSPLLGWYYLTIYLHHGNFQESWELPTHLLIFLLETSCEQNPWFQIPFHQEILNNISNF